MIRQSCGALVVVLVLLVSLALAAKGPCNVTVPGSFVSTIACDNTKDDGCTGQRVATVQQSVCANANTTDCTNNPNDLMITYQATAISTPTGSCMHGSYHWNCVADHSNKVSVGGGVDCT